ncbi:DUF6745 domain-containing protein [Nostoc sp. LPT]|uniref:DUF6745 domain-containing protein n=1 Tax=Nostoc sp. LPT TaxID=2815387 RepID=UPI001D5851F9|nr:hypothetical protein [Nostoc sp. LPT]MBN4004151.1 hypothetical protein [Nostoc sp. LPT]
MSLIEKLTPEQEALIRVYREKWRAIALSTERIDKEKVVEAVKIGYIAIRKQEPKIIFCDSPYAGLKIVIQKRLKHRLNIEFNNQLLYKFRNELRSQVAWQLQSQLMAEILTVVLPDLTILEDTLRVELKTQLLLTTNLRSPWFKAQLYSSTCSWVDFYISVLNCSYNQIQWQALQSLLKYCSWILPYENICIVCDRPLHLRFDNQNRLHAEGEPAIEFIDGYSLYSYHGVTLPEKYGKSHPQQWQSQWLLSEENAELRRVLIQGIGYARICQELQAIELDNWQEYTVLKIDNNVDIEPIYLLKMTCPSTSFIHALRVPPSMNSAREAIRWVNWGVDPEEFGVQT